MQSSSVLFQAKENSPYSQLKELFLELLKETRRTCKRTCTNAYDEERHAMITLHPEINEKAAKIDRAHAKILLESNVMQDEHEKLFYNYALGLCELKFNFLFMDIFSRKLKKHWLPLAEELGVKSRHNITCTL